MSATVTYKGSTITTVTNETKRLTTSGTWLEGDIIITDTAAGGESGENIYQDENGYIVLDDEAGSSGSSVQIATGTFTGADSRTQTINCPFEPDLIYIYGEKEATDPMCMCCLCIIRDTVQISNFYSSGANTTSHSVTTRNGISELDSSTTTNYTHKATYANGVLTLVCVNNNSRAWFASTTEYAYKFIKYT